MPAHYDFSVKCLPNGARIKMIQIEPDSGSGVVLAYRKGCYVDEHITWRFFNHDLASTSWGHYFSDPAEAKIDFLRRISEL